MLLPMDTVMKHAVITIINSVKRAVIARKRKSECNG